MRILKIFVVFLMFYAVSCGTAEKKKDPVMKGAREDSIVKVVDPDFKFENIKKVYLYNEVDDEDSDGVLMGLAAKLQEKGVEVVIDKGEAMKYENDDLRIKTYKNLMSVYFHVAILKPEGPKGNEETVATVKADSVPKLVDKVIEFIFGS